MKNVNNQTTFAKNHAAKLEALKQEEVLYRRLNNCFEMDVDKITAVLKKYSAVEIDWSDRRLEKFCIGEGHAFRCYIKVKLKKALTRRTAVNVETLLRNAGIPMPCAPVSNWKELDITVHTVYSSEKY
tara:strand:- start:762 stop:1145 length:384 start_codon:yes stop_codon:yes gene_type:complete